MLENVNFWKEKVILKIFNTQWHNWGREVTHWSWTSLLLTKMQLLFLVHDLSLLSPTEAHVHQHLELQSKSWLMDLKRFLNLGSKHGLLSPLEFLCPSAQELGFIQDLGSGGVTTRMFPWTQLSSVIFSWAGWCGWSPPTPASDHWETLASEMVGASINIKVLSFLHSHNARGNLEPPLHMEFLASHLSTWPVFTLPAMPVLCISL